VSIKLESVARPQRLRELLHCGTVDVFDASARAADRMVMMTARFAEHIRRLAIGIGARRDVPL
jgi:hypothetical protein